MPKLFCFLSTFALLTTIAFAQTQLKLHPVTRDYPISSLDKSITFRFDSTGEPGDAPLKMDLMLASISESALFQHGQHVATRRGDKAIAPIIPLSDKSFDPTAPWCSLMTSTGLRVKYNSIISGQQFTALGAVVLTKEQIEKGGDNEMGTPVLIHLKGTIDDVNALAKPNDAQMLSMAKVPGMLFLKIQCKNLTEDAKIEELLEVFEPDHLSILTSERP